MLRCAVSSRSRSRMEFSIGRGQNEEGRLTSQDFLVKYEHSWTDLPDILTPGQPFDVRLSVQETHNEAAETLAIGDTQFITGIMVTAGRDWIIEAFKNDSPERILANQYPLMPIEPSAQLYLAMYAIAGYITEEQTAPDQEIHARWVRSDEKLFTEPVPDKILDKEDYTTPKENIDDELMLVIIYAVGPDRATHVDSNYIYRYVQEGGGKGKWVLRTQFNTTRSVHDITEPQPTHYEIEF